MTLTLIEIFNEVEFYSQSNKNRIRNITKILSPVFAQDDQQQSLQ